MSRHSTTRAAFTGMTERSRLRGAAPRMYAGHARPPARPASPVVTWAILLLLFAVLIVLLTRL